MEHIALDMYIDGSYNEELHICSYGIVVVSNDEVIEKLCGCEMDNVGYNNMRNVGGEILSALGAMEYALKNKIKLINIYYDYLGIENWALGKWKTNNRYTAEYKDKYTYYSKLMSINFHKVKSHSGNKYNDLADAMAKEGALIRGYVN